MHEDGPAYECGLRSGDVIVTVSDWLITVMDKPEVRDSDKLFDIHSVHHQLLNRLHFTFSKLGPILSSSGS